MTELLRVKGLYKYFHLHGRCVCALDNIDLHLQQGEILGIAGESGSGKSTLARCITGLHQRDSGEVYFNGEALPARFQQRDFARQASRVQMIFQDPLSSLNPRMNIGDILCEPLLQQSSLGQRTLTASERRERAADWLVKVGLRRDDLRRYPHSFSGGQLQRIGIARALISEPQLLVCDEPVSALDVSVQAQIVNLLLDLRAAMHLSLLFIAHDLAMMGYLCDRIAVMQLGRIVECGDTASVLQQPQDAYTRALLAAHPHL